MVKRDTQYNCGSALQYVCWSTPILCICFTICVLVPTYIVHSLYNLSVSPHLELCLIGRLSVSPCHYAYHLHGSIYAHWNTRYSRCHMQQDKQIRQELATWSRNALKLPSILADADPCPPAHSTPPSQPTQTKFLHSVYTILASCYLASHQLVSQICCG